MTEIASGDPPRPASADKPRPGEPLLAGMLAASLFAASVTWPAVGLLATVSPFPLLAQRLRGGFSAAWVSTLVAGALVGAFDTPLRGLVFAVVFAVPVVIVGEGLTRGASLPRAALWGFAVLGLEILAALLATGGDMARLVLQPLDHLRSPRFLDEMRASGLPPERVEEWVAQLTTLRSALAVVYPAAYLILGAVFVFGNAVLLRVYLAWRDPAWLDGGDLDTARWPAALTVLFVLAGGGVAFPPLRPLSYNVLLVVGFFFALQGLAVVSFYVQRLAAPFLLRAAVLVLVLLNPWAPHVLALVGLFDNFFDFRRWAEPPPSA